MPALDADIGAGSRDTIVATWSSSAIASRYPSARDGGTEPATGYFDAVADAQTIIDARGALIGADRRRFGVEVQDVLIPTPASGVPQVRLVDTEQAVNGTFLASRIELDLEQDRTSYELFG